MRSRLVTVLMAKAFPKSQFFGYDFHPSSIKCAAETMRGSRGDEEHSVRGRQGQEFPKRTLTSWLFSIACTTWAIRRAQPAMFASLKPDGSWMIVEPMAGDKLGR